MQNILVYGFYHKNNIGDNLFIEAFQHLFPNYNFTFTDNITVDSLQKVSAVFIGGGSLLYNAPSMIEAVRNSILEILKEIPIFYIGVGAETEINIIHQDLMRIAKLIAIRSASNFDKIKSLNDNTICIPDLVYTLQSKVSKMSVKNEKSILVLPNISVVPQWNEPHWKHMAWDYFKFEFAQTLDSLIEGGYDIDFVALCQNQLMNDSWAAIEIINKMKYRDSKYLKYFDTDASFANITFALSKYKLIISQRFHGIILSEMMMTPYVALHHHDKLKKNYFNNGAFVSFFGISKQNLIDNINSQLNKKNVDSMPISTNNFAELVVRVNKLIGS